MLSNKIKNSLNEQIKLEFETSNIYLQMSSWASSEGLDGISKFMYKHSREEIEHMHKLFEYINKTGSMAIIPALSQPEVNYDDIESLFKKTYEREQYVTHCINKLIGSSLEEKDFSTFHFLQWYISEQHEEEALFKGILDKIDIIGNDKLGIYTLDNTIGEMV